MICSAQWLTNLRNWAFGVLLAFVCAPVWSVDYFVSSAGSDSANGQAGVAMPDQGSVGPFATLAPLAKLDLQHGDRIFLACGQKFQGPVRISLKSKLPGVLAISSYGDCPANERPTVHGRVSLAAPLGSGLKAIKQEAPVVQVFSGDTPMVRARFPLESYLIFPASSVSAADRIPAHPALSGKDLSGSVLHARTQEWFIEEKKVVGADGQLESPLRYPLRPKAGAYLTGKAWMIGDDNGWAYDHHTRTLHVRNKTAAPMSVVHAGHLFQIEGRGAVSIKGIAFDAAGGDAINVKLDGVVDIDNVLITRAAGNGISVSGSRFAQIANSYIDDTALDGIFFAEVARVVVRHNVVSNAGLYLGPGPSLAAINAHRTQAATIEENEVLRSSYIGIRFSGDAHIRGNLVESACLSQSDCGAIYTWRRGQNDLRPPVEVSGNAVINVKGDTTVKFGVNDWFSGIYLDEWTREANVNGNLVVNAGQGIYLHNARNNVVENNYIFGARHKTFIEKDDASALIGNSPVAREIVNRFAGNVELNAKAKWVLQKKYTKTSKSSDGFEAIAGNAEKEQMTDNYFSALLGAASTGVNGTLFKLKFLYLK
jgi:parallel beta-helix repeat protein